MELTPVGARIWVEEIKPYDRVQEISDRSGIYLVEYEKSTPRPTTGWVIAVGDDPFINERIRVGDIVFYSRHAGSGIVVEGKQYKVLEEHEITGKARGSREELEKLLAPPQSTPSPLVQP